MKIAVIAPSFVPSSAANSIQVMKICQAFQQTGADVALWVPLQKGQVLPTDWPTIQAFYGIETEFPVHWVKENLAFHRYDFAWKAALAAKRWGAEVIYTWMVQAGLLAYWWKILPALELHMLPTGKFGPILLRSFARRRKAKLLLPITNALKHQLTENFRIEFREHETLIAPMGSEPERYQEMGTPQDARRALNLPEQLTAVYTGHLYEGRGMELLLAVAMAFPSVNFLWIGGREPELSDWRRRVTAAGAANVTLTGFVNNQDLPLYQSAGDVLLMPYQSNVGISGVGDTASVCSPMKLFDYLSAGRAILTSDLPVFHEILHDTNAVFCPPEDQAAWIKAFGELIENPEWRHQLAAQAKQDAGLYSWQRRAEKTQSKLADLRQE